MDEYPMKQLVNCEIHKELKTQHAKGDRISNLPDHVLVHIISLLPIWSAVATSILSKRWKNVWTGINTLYLTHVAHRLKTHEDHTSFRNFLDKVALCNEGCCLQLVQFDMSGKIDRKHASEWISSLMKGGIRKLELDNKVKISNHSVENDKLMLFSPSFFTSHMLVELALSGNIFVSFPVSLQLPYVKVVSMNNILVDGTSVRNLLSGCPVLENLEIVECNGGGDIDVHSYSLKKLCIGDLDWPNDDVITINAPNLLDLIVDASCSFVISTPNVRELLVSEHCFGANFKISYMPSLEGVYLSFKGGIERGVSETLCSVRSVRSLTLVNSSMLEDDVQIRVFSNLTFLDVTISSWPFFVYLLELSPNLIHLVANFIYEDENTLEWSCPPRVPDCILDLEVFGIWGFDGSNFMLAVIEYIFSNAEMLEEMTIHLRGDYEHLFEPLKEILAEMAFDLSSDCKISVCCNQRVHVLLRCTD